jgi:hypothetical protein
MAGLKFPLIEDEKYEAKIIFSVPGGGSVILYMPEALTFNDGINYDNVNLGLAGMAAMEGAGFMKNNANIANPAAMVSNFQNEALRAAKALDNLGGRNQIMQMFTENVGPAASLLTQGITPEAISSGIALGSGITANPHKRSVFRDVGTRNFGFSFLMSPSSPAEGAAIEGIVDFFRENAYPEYVSGGKYAYKFPEPFKITMKYRNADMSQPPKIRPSFLTSVTTTFNPRSSSFFKDGKFNETQIALAFVEDRPLAKPDIQGGY